MNQDIEKVLLNRKELSDIIRNLGEKITHDYQNKNLLIVCVLKGSVYFFTDLSRHIDLPCRIDFIQASSYGTGTVSNGEVTMIKDIQQDLSDFDVLITEDILDTGITLKHIKNMLLKRNPRSVAVAVLLDKPSRRVANIKADYTGYEVEDEFVVGYGLDYNQLYRNLPYIGILKRDIYE